MPWTLEKFGAGQLWRWAELIALFPTRYDFTSTPQEVIDREPEDLSYIAPKGFRGGAKTAGCNNGSTTPAVVGSGEKRALPVKDSDTPAPKKEAKKSTMQTWSAAASDLLAMPPKIEGDADPKRWIAMPYRVHYSDAIVPRSSNVHHPGRGKALAWCVRDRG